MSAATRTPDDRFAGAALIGASLLSVAAMAHHPAGTGQPLLAQIVHAAMIAFVLVAFAGFIRLSARLGLERFSNLAALIVYGAGACANGLAATLNGFVALQLAGASADVRHFSWELNQALAYGAVYAASIAFLLWSANLVRTTGLSRIVGVVGLAAGVSLPALLLTGALGMNVAGAFVVYAVQAAFGVFAGALLMRSSSFRSDNA